MQFIERIEMFIRDAGKQIVPRIVVSTRFLPTIEFEKSYFPPAEFVINKVEMLRANFFPKNDKLSETWIRLD